MVIMFAQFSTIETIENIWEIIARIVSNLWEYFERKFILFLLQNLLSRQKSDTSSLYMDESV